MPEELAAPKVLVVEDEFVIALDLSSQLQDAGYQVCGPTGRTDIAVGLIDRDTPDMALLDVNLGKGETSCEIARLLMFRRIPFVFLSGYTKNALPADFADIPILAKPCPFKTVQETIERLVSASRRSPAASAKCLTVPHC